MATTTSERVDWMWWVDVKGIGSGEIWVARLGILELVLYAVGLAS